MLGLAALLVLAPATVRLESLDLSRWRQGWGSPQVNLGVDRKPLAVGGTVYANGLGSHAPGGGRFQLGGRATRLEGSVALSDSGHGTVAFAIFGDGRQLWRSETKKKGQAPTPFSVDLRGVRELLLTMSDAGDGSGGDHAAWIDVRLTLDGTNPTPLSYMRTFRPLIDRPRQTIDNFAASDSWTVEPLIRWPEAKRKEVARLLFDRQTGIGLSAWRHNLGGGLNYETISMPLRTVDTFDAGEGKFDFSRVPGKRWMLAAAKGHGVDQFIAYAITPPRRLTRNGFTTGTDGQGSTNLADGQEGAFARYLAGIVAHYRGQGYNFTHISPVNEPDFEWNTGTQEGNRASNADILRITKAIHDELAARQLPVRLLTPEANSPQVGFTVNEGMTKKYGAKYGAYATMFAEESNWRRTLNPVYGYHSYWADNLSNIISVRRRLREELNRSPGLKVWQTEYCQLSGPRNEGGWGRDLGMTYALNVARLVHFDLTLVDVSAWQYWLAVSDADYKDGLIYVDDLGQEGGGEIFASKTLWAFGNYSRFVRPGFQRIETEGTFEDVSGLLPSAFRDPKTGQVVIVIVNTETNSDSLQLSLPGQWTRRAWITSDRPGHDLAPFTLPAGEEIRVPSRSVLTLVLDPK